MCFDFLGKTWQLAVFGPWTIESFLVKIMWKSFGCKVLVLRRKIMATYSDPVVERN